MTEKEILKSKYLKILHTKMCLVVGISLLQEQRNALSEIIREALEVGIDFDKAIEKEREDSECEGRAFGILT